MKTADAIRALQEIQGYLKSVRPILDHLQDLVPPKKRSGRPKGSKNKPKFGDLANRSAEKVAASG